MPRDRFFSMEILKGSSEQPQTPGPKDEGQSLDLGGETGTPLLDIYENPESIVIEADLPGIQATDVAIRMVDNQVIIEGHRCGRGEGQGAGNYLRMERCIEDFRRIVPLPIAVDAEKAEASYRQGVLILRFPRIEDRRKKIIKIEIK